MSVWSYWRGGGEGRLSSWEEEEEEVYTVRREGGKRGPEV